MRSELKLSESSLVLLSWKIMYLIYAFNSSLAIADYLVHNKILRCTKKLSCNGRVVCAAASGAGSSNSDSDLNPYEVFRLKD